MNDKELVAFEAAKLAKNGMVIGLGTGSTANYFIEHLAKRQVKEGLSISTVASSNALTSMLMVPMRSPLTYPYSKAAGKIW